jgi:hypothetical protein
VLKRSCGTYGERPPHANPRKRESHWSRRRVAALTEQAGMMFHETKPLHRLDNRNLAALKAL